MLDDVLMAEGLTSAFNISRCIHAFLFNGTKIR